MQGIAPLVEVRQGESSDWKVMLTHIEIRRVQNGFVVMGFNAVPNYSLLEPPATVARVCFVCESIESLKTTIESLTTDAGNFAWSSSVDLPITDLFSHRKG